VSANATTRTSVLLVRLLAFGDVLLTLPVIEALVRSSNVAHVDLLTAAEFADDARRSPFVRQVFGYDAARDWCDPAATETTYDVIADLHNRGVPLDATAERHLARLRGRSRVGFASPHAPSGGHHRLPPRKRTEHAAEFYTRAVADLVDAPLGLGRITLDDRDRARAARCVAPRSVCLAPGARYPWKRWPAERYAAVAGRLAAAGITSVVVGHSFDRPYVDAVLERCPPSARSLVGGTGEVAAAMAASGVVVANNSGLNALASAAGARVVCVHSHTLPAMWRPWGPGHIDLIGDGTDMPCGCRGAAPQDLRAPCGKGIAVADVDAAVRRLVDGHGTEGR
jgi:ADP-heptose:LPS heptosyltransferase